MAIFPKKRKGDRGFTLVIAVLISSILLSIGVAMFNISLKESVLSSIGRESQLSFYAADAGDECALYWELKVPSPFDAANPVIQCNGAAVTVNSSSCVGGVGGICTHDLTYNLGPTSNDPCAKIHIVKDTDDPGNDDPVTDPVSTQIESRGYNTCNTSDPKRTERAIQHTL